MSTVESFEISGWHGEFLTTLKPRDLEAAVAQLADPGGAIETIHWGRNYLYSQELATESGSVEVVVKQFRNQGWRARLRRRLEGSKAEKSWRVARHLIAHGVRTAEPVILIESNDPEGPSLFVSRRVVDGFESRYFFRALNSGVAQDRFPQVDVDELLVTLAKTLRRMHEAKVWHRDVSVGNLLVRYANGGQPEIFILDLNRARTGKRPGAIKRIRDLCRLRIFEPVHQQTFLRAYWGRDREGYRLKQALYRLYHRVFLWRNEAKKRLRSPFAALAPRRAHAHIPEASTAAGVRDRIVWDHLSDQPHQHAGRWRRLGVRLADGGTHARELAVCARSLPRIAWRYRQLRRGGRPTPVTMDGIGLALRPWPTAPGELLAALEVLGVRRILLRLHPWAEGHGEEEALARELHGRGYDLAFALPQNRELVRDTARWRSALDELAERFTPFGQSFQVGQAVNRSKWGIWRYDEYEPLVAAAREAFSPYPDVELLGPAVIDFELYATAALLNMKWRPGLVLDGVASLLYVDRRGAPESRQLGLDTIGKVTLLKAIAETARNAASKSWITEFNWPLLEGPHSPAGRKVAVGEEQQADYLVRYYLLALCTGLVDRVYWWQLIARGYGLVADEVDGKLRRRPSYAALAALTDQLAGARFERILPSPAGTYLYEFTRGDGGRRLAGWAATGEREAELPAMPSAVWSRDGVELPAPTSPKVELTSSPRYFLIDGGAAVQSKSKGLGGGTSSGSEAARFIASRNFSSSSRSLSS